MSTSFNKEINGVRRNLANGLRSLLFRRIALKEFYVSHDQLVILAIFLSGVIFFGSFILSLPEPEFSVYGIATVTTQLLFLALGVYLFSKVPGKKEHILPLYIVLLSIWPLFHLIWLAIGKSATFNYWNFYGENKYFYIFLNIWIAAVVVNVVSRAVGVSKKSIFLILAIYVAILGVPLNYLVFGNFWHPTYHYDAEYKKYKSINQEVTYYRQFQFIEEAKAQLLSQRKGVSDIYFVGFGSYASQDVFMKEVQYAKRVLDEKYDTQGRSIALINNIKTLEDTPLASKSNLTLVLDHIGKLIDPEEDILFLYLTSHGSKEQQLSVKLMPLTLNSIGPSDLKAALESSNIKYRVILVSACYSGGFVEPLIDDYTVVFTASAKDKKSFGCGSKNNFTYFGRAVFKEHMEHNYNLIDAFGKAIESIRIRENAGKLEPSEPQLFIGNKIREKLLVFTEEIKKYNRKKSSGK